jgi:hypothetical protein
MARDFTTNALIESIKRRGNIPINQATFTGGRILAMADEEILSTVLPMVRQHRNDHFVTYTDTTMTSATEYTIPANAMNRGLFNVAILDSAGKPYSLIPVDFDLEIDMGAYLAGRRGYYVRGDKIHIYPDSPSGSTLRLYYERLPNRLCLSHAITVTSESAEAGRITGISGGVITCSGGVPSSITTSTPICAVDETPGFALLFEAVTPSAVTSTTVTTTSANAALCAVGDWIALDGDSPIVQLPIEAHPVLAQAVYVKCLEAMGDEYVQVAQQKLEKQVLEYNDSFPHRTEKGPRTILSRNRLADWCR